MLTRTSLRLMGLLLLALAALSAVALPARAQSNIDTLDFLSVELWPDYDRAATLVLLTGTLPADTQLPAVVEIPISAEADLNVVARIDDLNRMTDDVVFEQDGEVVRFTTPDLRFRVEYYLPYQTDGDSRQIAYLWQSPLSVGQLSTSVQQPLAATNFTITPEAVNIATAADGMDYHTLPAVALAANESYGVEVAYTLPDDVLSAEILGGSVADPDGVNWPLIVGVVGAVLLLVALVWQMMSGRRKQKRVARPRPKRAAKSSTSQTKAAAPQAKFCHQCGHPRQPEDQFCRQCGTKLKA